MLRNNISDVDFADNPFFADLVLIPLLRLGNAVSMVSGFVPSYVNRTLERIIEVRPSAPGKFTFVLCLPALPASTSALHAIAGHVAAEQMVETKTLIELVGKGVSVGLPFEIQILVPSRGAVITRSSIGVIEDQQDDSARVGFIDELAGDNNSLIHLSRSWVGEEAAATERFEDLVYAAINNSWESVERVADFDLGQLADLIGEVKPGTPPADEHSETAPPPPTPPAARSAAEKSNNRFEDPALDLLDDGFANDDYDDLVDVEADFDEIMGIVELSDGEVDSIFNAFYGDPSQTQLLGDFARARSRGRLERPHAAPASAEILNLVGDINYQCWCGNEYSIREGCADYFSNQ